MALKLKDVMWEERSRHSQTYPRQCKSYIFSVPNSRQERKSSSLLSIKKQSSVSRWGINPFPVYEDLAWLCVFDSDSRSEVCCAVSFLSHRESPETITADDAGVPHKDRGHVEQVWAGELEPPGLWKKNHDSWNIYLDTSDSWRVNDGQIGRK